MELEHYKNDNNNNFILKHNQAHKTQFWVEIVKHNASPRENK